MANNTSQHILTTSSNLLGFCLIVITSLHIADYAEASIIDELTSVVAISLIFSSIFSFFSIRTSNPGKEKRLETLAESLFIIALGGILVIILFITFNFIK